MTEAIKPNIEKKEENSRLEKELTEIENSYSGIERAELARDIIREIDDPKSTLNKNSKLKPETKRIESSSGIDVFLLPGMSQRNKQQIEENYKRNNTENTYQETASHRVIPVGQGKLLDIPQEEKIAYATTNMSHCSLLVGFGKDRMSVAHISYSLAKQTDAALDHMQDKNTKPDNIYGVINTNPQPLHENTQFDTSNRLTQIDDYTSIGIPEENLRTFAYRHKENENGDPYHFNGQYVITCKDFIFSTGYKQQISTRRHHSYSQELLEEREQIITIS